MWGKILISLLWVWMMSCHGTAITCDPTASNSCPMASNGTARICDPTGICQMQCNNSSDCTDPGTICDHSSSQILLCQTDCKAALCPTGQFCRNFNIASTSTGDATKSESTCKLICSQQTGANCSGNPIFTCQPTGTSSSTLNICWGLPNSQ